MTGLIFMIAAQCFCQLMFCLDTTFIAFELGVWVTIPQGLGEYLNYCQKGNATPFDSEFFWPRW